MADPNSVNTNRYLHWNRGNGEVVSLAPREHVFSPTLIPRNSALAHRWARPKSSCHQWRLRKMKPSSELCMAQELARHGYKIRLEPSNCRSTTWKYVAT